MADLAPPPAAFDAHVPTVIVGAGACGLIAALAAQAAGQQVLVLERDPVPAGSTALSAGLIPAAGTAQQRAAGIDDDDPARFAADIQAKARGRNDPALVALLAGQSGAVMDWMTRTLDMPFTLVDDFDYPGHSRRRMHGLPTRAGRELIDTLRARAEAKGIDILCDAPVDRLFTQADGRVRGLRIARPGGGGETLACDRLILACNGFGGNRAKVAQYMPDIADALWFGHDGNRGAALDWGLGLGARTRHLGAYQGHGNVAHPYGILITWAVITGGGVQVNALGERFWDESQGYSEAARAVLSQPGGVAVTVFDARLAATARQFADFRAAEAQGAIKTADTLDDLARQMDLPADRLGETLARCHAGPDRFGRDFATPPLRAPFCAVRVTGALFHTQGGLVVDERARVMGQDAALPNLYAAGGAACGVSGSDDSGYLSGNGLLAAAVLGHIAGGDAA
ncbi:MAG: FAD-dependent oxidoreductase [Rhodobacteraceae bacterium]|nr:FAD-dependent oxidoreductase [Paracoccaceae bacterium]